MPYEPLTVTAHLATAYSSVDSWSPSLDGILAYWWLREQLGDEEFALGMSGHRPLVEPELPLGREEHDGLSWWQCSSPIAPVVQRAVRHFHRRFDDAHAYRYLPDSTKKILTSAGPYKAYRHPRTLHVAPYVQWHCIGDADAIRRLLRRCVNIGFGHTKGYGQVTHWEIEPGGNPDLARFHRPLPVAFAAAHGITGMELVWGIRPPGRAPEHQVLCVMPRPDRDSDPEDG